MDPTALTVLAVPGSLRAGSLNRLLLEAATALAPARMSISVDRGPGDLPLFSEDDEGDRTPPAVRDLRMRISAADALLIATPEYNGGMPGGLKNALDWLSRPSGESVLTDRPTAVLGASPGRFGASWAQAEVRKVVTRIGASVLETELPVARADKAFDADGHLTDADAIEGLEAFLAEFAGFAAGPVSDERDDLTEYSISCQRRDAVCR